MEDTEPQSQEGLQMPRRTQTLNIRRELFKDPTLDQIPTNEDMHILTPNDGFISSRPSLKKILKHVLYREGKWLKTPKGDEKGMESSGQDVGDANKHQVVFDSWHL